jgi:hypothetical protein
MADRKISDLTALTTPASGDYLPIVDISEAAAASKNKRITIEELFRGVPLGTAAAPSIAIEGDEDTGVFSPGANQLAVATNGTGRLFVDASGNIGVGTSSPVNVGNYNTIHLAGRNATTGGIFRSTSSDNSIIGLFFTDSNGVYTGTDTNHPYRIATNGGERLRVTEAGLVGIGTSAPGTSLDVRGIISLGSSSVANAVIQKSAVPGGSFNLTITSGGGLTSESATTPTDALAGSVIKLLGGDPTTDTFGGGIQYYANGSTSPNGAGVGNQHAFYTRSAANTYTERLRITSAGNVGIGNSSPAELLDVSGAIKHGNVGYIADGDLGFIYTGINNSTYGTVIGTKPGTTYGTSRNFTVSLNPATGPGREVFRIVGQSGRVGIGTSAPAARTEIRQDGSSAVELLRLVNDDTSGAGSTIKFKNFYNSALISSTSNPGFSQGGTLRLQTFNGNGVLNTGLAMDNQGRVGIGTTGPSAPLHVLNSSGAEIRAASSAGAELTIWEGGGVSGNPDTTRIGVGRNNTSLIFQNTSGPARNAFAIGTSGAVPLILSTSNLERVRIDSSGRLLVGTSTSVAAGSITPSTLQVSNASGIGATLYSVANASGPGGVLVLGHGRATAAGLLSSGDVVGQVRFAGGDGGDLETLAAQISVEVDGTPGANDMPGRLVFSTTADGASSTTERLRITSTGQLRLAGAGITFNGDTAAANELDDYEEGTFTPTIQGLSAAGTVSYLRNTGRYTKIGNIVHITLDIKIDTVSVTPTGGLVFAALPFTSANVEGEFVYPGAVRFNGVSLPAGSLAAYAIMLNNSTIARIQTLIDNAAPESIDGSNIAANDELQWSCTYRTA